MSPWGQGSAATCLLMEKGQYTVDGACQGPCQSQGGAPLPCAQGAIRVSENQATGPGQKSQQGDGVSGPEQLILGTGEVISFDNIGAPRKMGLMSHSAETLQTSLGH